MRKQIWCRGDAVVPRDRRVNERLGAKFYDGACILAQCVVAVCIAAMVFCRPVTAATAAGRAPPPIPLALAGARGTALLCEAAIRRAESKYDLPRGLLFAIGLAETGRVDPLTRRVRPWPWSVQFEGAGYYFDTQAQAVRWVTAARARGVTSIDTGCLQVNLLFHPQAFATLDAAFDPDVNVDFAARFLAALHAATKDWERATGLYHSSTPSLAQPYASRVARAMGQGGWPDAARLRPIAVADELKRAWGATLSDAPAEQDGMGRWGRSIKLEARAPGEATWVAAGPAPVADRPAAVQVVAQALPPGE